MDTYIFVLIVAFLALFPFLSVSPHLSLSFVSICSILLTYLLHLLVSLNAILRVFFLVLLLHHHHHEEISCLIREWCVCMCFFFFLHVMLNFMCVVSKIFFVSFHEPPKLRQKTEGDKRAIEICTQCSMNVI